MNSESLTRYLSLSSHYKLVKFAINKINRLSIESMQQQTLSYTCIATAKESMYREFLADCKPCPKTVNARTANSLLFISKGNSFFRPKIVKLNTYFSHS